MSNPDEISGATFDILERMSRDYPWLKAHYARGTGGVDVNTVVAVLWDALTDARKALAGRYSPEVLAAHAQFGGDLADMQRRYDNPTEHLTRAPSPH